MSWNLFPSFTAAHLQQNSYPERRPWEDLIDLRLSHSSCFRDACSDLLALHQCVISAKAQTESDEILEYFFQGFITQKRNKIIFLSYDLIHHKSAAAWLWPSSFAQLSLSLFFFYTCHNNIHLQCFLLFFEWMKLSSLFNKGCLCILCEAGVTHMWCSQMPHVTFLYI